MNLEIPPEIQDTLLQWGMAIISALLVLIVGRWVAGKIARTTRSALLKRRVDEVLVSFAYNITNAALMILVLVVALTQLGISTATLVAVLGAATLAVGLALQGSLGHLASGVLIIFIRPFSVGNFVTIAGEGGFVEEIQLLTTKLRTPDNKTIFVPNSQVMSNSITNFVDRGTRRLDMVVGVSYSDDLKKVTQILTELIEADARCLKDPAPTIKVDNMGDSSMDFIVRPWVNVADYWDVKWDLTQKIKERFDEEDITIPFPQRDVHLFQKKAE